MAHRSEPASPEPPARQPALFEAPTDATLVAPADSRDWQALATRLGPNIRLGTSSWNFPGWRGLVWNGTYSESTLARHGLGAYGRHPLLRTVSVDRSFHRSVDATTFARMAAQVPPDFRFVVKAPALVTDAHRRDAGSGRSVAPNPAFLDPQLALDAAVRPARDGLGARLGVLVFQLSPLGSEALGDLPGLLARLDALLEACAGEMPEGAWLAVEVRDPALLSPALAALLRRHDARYCLGLHDRMPPLADQLPMLRATWPGPLVCRWNLQRGLHYVEAKDRFAPFDRLVAPDPATRSELARVAAATASAGQAVFVTINNKAEGSAPRSVTALAEAIDARLNPPPSAA